MNLQESIRRVLKEETDYFRMIRRRVPQDDLEREFEESLDMASDNFSYFMFKNRGEVMDLKNFTDITTSILIDGIHHELYSSIPNEYEWYDKVKETLKDFYKDRIEVRYRKLISKI